MKRLLIIMLFCISFASCAVIQESRVVSKSSYDEVWHACVTSFSDIGYSIINTDKKSGIVVAERGSILNSQTVTKLNIILKESANGVSVNVKYIPPPGMIGGGGTADLFITALRKRIPDIKIVTSE